jgi:VWFA-related protein
MRPWASVPLSLAATTFAVATSLHAVSSPRTTFVELDVVALDSEDHPVSGLRPQDIIIKEDGGPVAVTSFTEVAATGNGRGEDGRSLVLLLDDTAPLVATRVVQNISTLFLSRAGLQDRVDIVRITHRADELTGNASMAADKLQEFRGGAASYFGRTPFDTMLQTLTRISRSLASIPHRRKAIVCIGHLTICDPYVRVPEDSMVWHSWRNAISAAAQANASLYMVDAGGVTGGVDLGSGVVEATGGVAFVRSNNFERAANLIWEQLGHYYLLGYTPIATPHELHEINVSIPQSGVHALARNSRGD